MGDMITKKAHIMINSILVVMNRKSQKREGKTNKDNINKSFIHQPTVPLLPMTKPKSRAV
jgi:hypothetical protein